MRPNAVLLAIEYSKPFDSDYRHWHYLGCLAGLRSPSKTARTVEQVLRDKAASRFPEAEEIFKGEAKACSSFTPGALAKLVGGKTAREAALRTERGLNGGASLKAATAGCLWGLQHPRTSAMKATRVSRTGLFYRAMMDCSNYKDPAELRVVASIGESSGAAFREIVEVYVDMEFDDPSAKHQAVAVVGCSWGLQHPGQSGYEKYAEQEAARAAKQLRADLEAQSRMREGLSNAPPSNYSAQEANTWTIERSICGGKSIAQLASEEGVQAIQISLLIRERVGSPGTSRSLSTAERRCFVLLMRVVSQG